MGIDLGVATGTLGLAPPISTEVFRSRTTFDDDDEFETFGSLAGKDTVEVFFRFSISLANASTWAMVESNWDLSSWLDPVERRLCEAVVRS